MGKIRPAMTTQNNLTALPDIICFFVVYVEPAVTIHTPTVLKDEH